MALGQRSARKCPCMRRTRSDPWRGTRAGAPGAARARSRRQRQSLAGASAPAVWRRARCAPPGELWVRSEPPRDQRQGPECATSLRSHVSRRRRLKMTMASWHRGESWTPGSRRSGAEARLALPEAPLRPSPPEGGGAPRPTAPAPRSAAAPAPASPLHSQASASGDASWGAAPTSSRSPAAPARAAWGTGAK